MKSTGNQFGINMLKSFISFFSVLLVVGTLALTPAVCPSTTGSEQFYSVSEQGVPLLPLCTTEESNEGEPHQVNDCAWSALSGLTLIDAVDLVPTPTFIGFKVSDATQEVAVYKQAQQALGRAPPLS